MQVFSSGGLCKTAAAAIIITQSRGSVFAIISRLDVVYLRTAAPFAD